MAVEDEFERIMEDNPDLNGGEPVVTVRAGAHVVSMTQASFEASSTQAGEELLKLDTNFRVFWADLVEGLDPLLQALVGDAAYRYAMLRILHERPLAEVPALMRRLGGFVVLFRKAPWPLEEVGV